MVEKNLEKYQNQINSCSLDKHVLKERLQYLRNDLGKRAIATRRNGQKISMDFPFDRALVNELLEVVFFENNCCGNMKIDLQFDMLKQTLTADFLLIE